MKKALFVIKLFLSLFFLTLGVLVISPKARATCDPKCSTWSQVLGQTRYECQSGTMCCTGNGCPSWACVVHGYGLCEWNEVTDVCEWYQDTSCTYCTGWCEAKSNPKDTCGFCSTCDPSSWSRCGSDCTQSNDCSFTADRSCTGGDCGGNKSPTCSIDAPSTVISADPVSVTITASDPDGTVSSYLVTKTGGTLSSTTNPTFTWTPPSTTTATYTINTKVTDNEGAAGNCSKSITVNAGYTLTVKTKLMNSSVCYPTGTVANLSNVSLTIRRAVSPYTLLFGPTASDGTGTAVFSSVPVAEDLLVCASYASTTCETYSNRLDCSVGDGVPADSNCLKVSSPVLPSTAKTIYMHFVKTNSGGWVTAIDGNIEANAIGSGLNCQNYTTELSAIMDFTPTVINFFNNTDFTTRAYLFSNSTSVEIPSDSNSLIEDITRGGWAFKTFRVGGNYSFMDKLTYTVPGTWFTTTTTLGTGVPTNPNGLYKMTVTDFNNYVSTGNKYNLKCN
jgi:hypothetical protein